MTQSPTTFICLISHRLTLVATFMIVVPPMSTACDDVGKNEPSKRTKQKATELKSLVDALVNHNPRPKIVEGVGESIAIFDKRYDWKEQDRVLRAIQEVVRQATPEMWEILVSRENDEQYCLTFADESGFAQNESVGEFCEWIAYDQLQFPVRRNEERINRERAANDLKHVFLGGISESLKKWRAVRSGKTFVELQIEVCERAIEELSSVKGVSADAKADCRDRLKEEIDNLKRTKAGIFGGFKFPGDRYEIFDEERAKELRADALNQSKFSPPEQGK